MGSESPMRNHLHQHWAATGPLVETEPRRTPAPRFLSHLAGEEWAGREKLAKDCELAALSEFQAQAVLECARGGNAQTFAEKHRCSMRTARATIERAANRIQGRVNFQQRKNAYWREVLECMKPEKGGEAQRPQTGLLPYINPEGYDTWGEYLQARRDPRNNRTVAVRAKTITEHDLEHCGEAILQEAFS
jgi:hypothetical protein